VSEASLAPWRLSLLLLAACGYHAVYGGGGEERLHVKVVRAQVPDAAACDEVASGVRDELARGGALEAGEGYPRVEIEVLGASAVSEGVAAVAGEPVARGTGVGVVARAWIARGPGAPPESDTGDLRAEDTIAVDRTAAPGAGAADPRAASFHDVDALRAAARRLGRSLARKLMGLPASSEDTGAP
jgi:hypothetical protein